MRSLLNLVVLLVTALPALASELDMSPPLALDPAGGGAAGDLYQAWLSPHQEGGEEEDTPRIVPDMFQSTAPSTPRDARPSRGHGTLLFARDYSRAWVHLAIEGVAIDQIAMLHIHCGKPGQLGPIIIDFGIEHDVTAVFEDGVFATEITNADITAVTDHGHGLVGAVTAGCPIIPAVPTDKVKTIAGLAHIAAEGELYFNLHTFGQMYFGDIRGQLKPVR
ncbi:MAG: CHRD domain-containing protein [Pseudomonadota bacterium]